jgi:hypothetical protein
MLKLKTHKSSYTPIVLSDFDQYMNNHLGAILGTIFGISVIVMSTITYLFWNSIQ